MNFWTQGPWMLFNMSVRFMQSWQEECFSRLRLMPVARPYAGISGLTAQYSGKSFAALRDQTKTSELQQLNAEVAARQGRATPLLGCLQNVEVVGGPETVATRPAEKAVPARPALAKAVDSVPKPVVKKAEPVVVALRKPVLPAVSVVEAEEPVAAPAASASSVTSMLAMQAKSLAKAVTTSPRQPAAKEVTKVEKRAEKPAEKAAVKSVAKGAEKSAEKAVAKTAVKKPAAKSASKPATKTVAKAKPVASKKS